MEKTIQAIDLDVLLLPLEKSEEVRSHDLQWGYTSKRHSLTSTLYRMEFKDIFLTNNTYWQDPATGQMFGVGYVNAGRAISHGLELEARYSHRPWLRVSADYSYVISSKWDQFTFENSNVPEAHKANLTLKNSTWSDHDLNFTGAPKHMYVLQLDYDLKESLSLNVCVRGNSGAITRSPGPQGEQAEYRVVSPSQFFDLNLNVATLVWGKKWNANLFIKNILNKRHELASPLGGVVGTQGSQIGIILRAAL